MKIMKTFKPYLLFTIGIFISHFFSAQSACIDSSLISPNVICTSVFEPVCGCDQVTYNNACEAVNYYGVSSFTPGPCNPTSCQADFYHVDSACFVEYYGSGASSYEWYFGDGTSSQGAYAFHNYTNNGFYTTCMYAYDSQGVLCDTVCQEIYVQGCGQVNLCDAGFQYSSDSICNYTFYGYGATTYEWWYDDMVFVGETVSVNISTNSSLNLCMYAFDEQGALCDTICETFTCNMTGIDDMDVQSPLLTVYPNPSNDGYFNVNYEGQITALICRDLSGRAIAIPIDLERGIVDASSLEYGKYFLQIQSNEKTFFESVVVLK